MLKIVSYFQFILIESHFEIILKESMIVEISNTNMAKASIRKRWLQNCEKFFSTRLLLLQNYGFPIL